MIQDIEPLKFNNSYKEKKPKEDSVILYYKDRSVLVKENDGNISFPTYNEVKDKDRLYTYLFSIDDKDYFLAKSNLEEKLNDYEMKNIQLFRTACPKYLAFAGITGFQLYNWYENNKFCGRCGKELEKDHKERMLHCKCCNNMVYPKICPAVIVGVTNGDKLLMTKYAQGEYKEYGLVAGFAEVGETIEETVKREVMEEVGLKVKNIRYYKSQPWSFSDTLLMGFFVEVDGDISITRDEEELAVAEWIDREDIKVEDTDLSLTNEMILKFKNKELIFFR